MRPISIFARFRQNIKARCFATSQPVINSKLYDQCNIISETEELKGNYIYHIKSYCIGNSIQIQDFLKTFDISSKHNIRYSSLRNSKSLVIQLEEDKFMQILSFGAVVFFNCPVKRSEQLITKLSRNTKGYLDKSVREEDDFKIEVASVVSDSPKIDTERIIVDKLNLKYLKIIGEIIGKSIALAEHEKNIEGIFAEYNDIISQKTPSDAKILSLFRKTNRANFNMMQSLKILDRSSFKENAWQDNDCNRVWEGMRSEFELEHRWDIFKEKSSYIKRKLRFLNSERSMNTSLKLSHYISLLILLEIVLSLMEFKPYLLD